MRRSLFLQLLLLLLLASLLPACGSRPVMGRSDLTWDGSAITGLPFYEREFPLVRIHYAEPTMPDIAERLGEYAHELLAGNKALGRLEPGERVDLWLLPNFQAWPDGAPNDKTSMFGIRAIAPRTVFLPGPLITSEQWKLNLEFGGLPGAIAVALTQEPGSPAFTVGWLHDGMGRVVSMDLRNFPGGLYEQRFSGNFQSGRGPWKVDHILSMLDPETAFAPGRPMNMSPQEAAGAVAGLLIDRWGLNWWEYYDGNPEELTPIAAIQWATGAADDNAAKKAFTDRMKQAIDNHLKLAYSGEANVVWPVSQADWGENRLKPKLKQRPKPGNNVSPQAYRFDVRWDPATRTVAGDETLTWTNGEGVEIDRLYFNLWGNSTGALWYGGYTAVDSVTVNGQAVPFAARGMDLDVPLVQGVQPGERIEVRIAFRTRLPILRPELPPGRGNGQEPPKPKPAPGEELSLSLWYPALAVLDEEGWHPDSFPLRNRVVAERADYEVRITVPQGTRVIRLGQQPRVTEAGTQLTYAFSDKDELWSATLVAEKQQPE